MLRRAERRRGALDDRQCGGAADLPGLQRWRLSESLKAGIWGTLCEYGEGSACNPLYFEKLLLRLEQL